MQLCKNFLSLSKTYIRDNRTNNEIKFHYCIYKFNYLILAIILTNC